MPQSTVFSITCCLREQTAMQSRMKMGRKRKLSERGMRLLQRYIIQYCFEPMCTITGRFNAATKLKLSVVTVRHYDKILNIRSYIAIQKPFLSKRNVNNCIQWGLKHKDWKLTQQSNDMFTDEASFSVHPMRNRLRVWRKKKQYCFHGILCLHFNLSIKCFQYGVDFL